MPRMGSRGAISTPASTEVVMGLTYTGRDAGMHATGVDSGRRRSMREQRAGNGFPIPRPRSFTMESNTTMLWTGRVLTGLAVAFLLFDGAIKFTHHPAVAEATAQLGWPIAVMPTIGVVLLTCVALYVFPPTAVL